MTTKGKEAIESSVVVYACLCTEELQHNSRFPYKITSKYRKDCLLKLRKHWTSCERKRRLFRKPELVSNCSWSRNRQIALTDSVYTFTSPSEQTLPSCLIWLKHCVPEPLQILTSKQASRSLSKELNSTALAFKSMQHKLDWCWKIVVQNTNMNASMHCNLFCLYSGSIWSDPQQQATH